MPKVTELTAGLKPRTYHALLSVERQREEKKEGRKKSFQDFLETRLRNVGNDVRNYMGQHIRDKIVTVSASLKRREGALGAADHEAELVLHSFWWLKFWQNSTVSLVT